MSKSRKSTKTNTTRKSAKTDAVRVANVVVNAPRGEDLNKLQVYENIVDGLVLVAKEIANLRSGTNVILNGKLDVGQNFTIQGNSEFSAGKGTTVTLVSLPNRKKSR